MNQSLTIAYQPFKILLLATLILSFGTVPAASQPKSDRVLPGGYTEEEVRSIEPQWPNPYLSYLPLEAEPDYDYWRARMILDGEARRSAAPKPPQALVDVVESEPNDTQATANPVPGFGTDCADPSANITGTLTGAEFDFFSIELQAGDILGLNLVGGTRVTLYDPAGVQRIGSSGDASFLYPASSPLPGGGDAVSAYVAETTGTWAVRVEGLSSDYTLEARVFRDTVHQILYLDFDGAEIDPVIFGGPAGVVSLSPLSNFLAAWGLTPGDEDAVIDAVIAAFEESVSEDPRINGNNGDFGASGAFGTFNVEIRNSRDHGELFGQPNVSRVIIGGTIAEFGIGTIGIAQTIDVGNFETVDDSVVLLDLLSAGAANGNSLNQFAIDPSATKVELVGIGVGNIAAHEAGHFLGNYHTEQFVGPANIQDQGGNMPGLVGVGPDGIFGTADDIDVDFITDVYVANEGFTGVEDTLNELAFGIAKGLFADDFECGDLSGWSTVAP